MTANFLGSIFGRALAALLVVIAAALIAAGLQYGLGVQRVSMFYFSAVLVCSAWLGLSYGLAAAVVATVAFNFVSGEQPWVLSLGSRQDFTNLIAYAAGAWVMGLYADEVRQKADALSRLTRPDPGSAPSASASLVLNDVGRGIAAFGLTAVAGGLAFAVERGLGVGAVSMIYLGATVVAAVALGTRFALITAASGMVAYDFLHLEPRFELTLDPFQALVNLVAFVGLAWWVGRFADRATYERGAVQGLFSAGRSLSASASDQELRLVLCEAVAAATGGGCAVVRDGGGEVSCEAGDRRGLALPDGGAIPPGQIRFDGSWRSRRLVAEGRDFGSVAWLPPTTPGRLDEAIDRTVAVLAEIGAAALWRAWLSAENARMEAAASTERLQRAVLASVSHDLRTPLSGILGSATTLLDYGHLYDEPVRRDLLVNIREQGHRLQRYIDNVLGLTRLETGILKPQFETHPLEPLTFEAWRSVVESAQHRRADISVEADLLVRVDPALFQQALGNVLDNAAKFSPKDAPITVRAVREGAQVVLSIADCGPGLSAEEAGAVLQPFARGRAAKASGVGLGLYIARSFMEAMAGSIALQPRTDGASGLEVQLAMPAAREG